MKVTLLIEIPAINYLFNMDDVNERCSCGGKLIIRYKQNGADDVDPILICQDCGLEYN